MEPTGFAHGSTTCPATPRHPPGFRCEHPAEAAGLPPRAKPEYQAKGGWKEWRINVNIVLI